MRKRPRHKHEEKFPCGHPRTIDNVHRYSYAGGRQTTDGERCRLCFNAYMRKYQRKYRAAGRDTWMKKQKRRQRRAA